VVEQRIRSKVELLVAEEYIRHIFVQRVGVGQLRHVQLDMMEEQLSQLLDIFRIELLPMDLL